MAFKLVRVDAEGSNKIPLPLGTHLIGRSSCLDCDDKRISRNHGKLIVSEDSIVIEALHQNPCFFTKKDSIDVEVLRKCSSLTLQNGDRFGLLPTTFWYEVLHCNLETDSQATDVSSTQEQVYSEPKNHDDTKTNEVNDRPNKENVETNAQNDERIQDVTRNSNTDDGIEDNSELLDFDLNETVDDVGRPESPSLLDKEQQGEAAVKEPSPNPELNPDTTVEEPTNSDSAIKDCPEGSVATEPVTEDPQPQATDPEQQSAAPKRSHSLDGEEEGVKKIKTEPVDEKDEPAVKQEPSDPSPGSSNQAGASNSAADGNKTPPSPAKPPNRERCLYGANCYRRNPAHKAQFSHPTDADWGPGALGACPYGAACRKRDPRHWDTHEHPPGTHPLPPAGGQMVVRRGNVFYINAQAVHFHDDHFEVEDSEGDSVDFDYEF